MNRNISLGFFQFCLNLLCGNMFQVCNTVLYDVAASDGPFCPIID